MFLCLHLKTALSKINDFIVFNFSNISCFVPCLYYISASKMGNAIMLQNGQGFFGAFSIDNELCSTCKQEMGNNDDEHMQSLGHVIS